MTFFSNWKSFSIVALSVVASACSTESAIAPSTPEPVDAALLVDPDAAIPPDPDPHHHTTAAPPEVVLTIDDVDAFIDFVMASADSQALFVRDQVERNADSLGIAEALVTALAAEWPFQNGVGLPVDEERIVATFQIFQGFRSPALFTILDDMVWRAVPTDPKSMQEVEVCESVAVEALTCVPTAQAQSEARRAAASHPDLVVRSAAADALKYPNCRYGQPMTP